MSKSRRQILIILLVATKLWICMVISATLTVGAFSIPRLRLFYVADTRAEVTLEERFAVESPATLDLTNTRGDVQLIAGDGDQFVVKATVEAWGQDAREAEGKARAVKVEMALHDSVLRIGLDDPGGEILLVIGTVRSSRVKFEIATPKRTNVAVQTREGHIKLEGTEGNVSLANRHGPVSIVGVSGNITVDARNDATAIHRSGGERATLSVRGAYGNITAQEVTARELTLDSSNGALSLEEVVVDEALALTTRYGKIDLENVQSGSSQVETANNSVTLSNVQSEGGLDLPNQYGDIDVRQVSAKYLDIDTHNGALRLEGVTVDGGLVVEGRYVKVDLDDVRATRLELKNHNESVTLNQVELNGALDVHTTYGAVHVTKSLATEYAIETRSDAIQLDGCRGPLRLQTQYGDIAVTNAADASLDLSTKNAKVSFAGSLSDDADHRVEDEYGDVIMSLPSDTAVSLGARTRYGRIRCEFPVLLAGERDAGRQNGKDDADVDELRGRINGGTAGLWIETSNGDIAIEAEP